jgi:uncharacterized protein YjbI with pentapeptide repeats
MMVHEMVRDEGRSVQQKKLVRKAGPPTKRRIAWPKWTGFRGKSVWDWLQLLIVPFVLAVIGFYFTSAQEYAHQLQIEARRAAEARELEEQRVQNAALQTYLEGMRQLLLDKDLLASEEGSSLRAIATAQTSSSLGQMSPEGKGIALLFLYESSLIDKENPVISLSAVRLRGADVSDVELHDANLSHANLISAEVRNAFLSNANLSNANLYKANLSSTSLNDANLSHAYLSDAILGDNAELIDANLSGANLSGANLSGATGVTEEQLEEGAKTLKGATMPDGSKHP